MFGKTKPVKISTASFSKFLVKEKNGQPKNVGEFLEKNPNFKFSEKTETFGFDDIDESETGKALGALIFAVQKK